MEEKIKSITKECGKYSIYFSTDSECNESVRVDEIKKETTQIDVNNLIVVYRGYKNDNPVFEMGATTDVTVLYE